MKRGRSKEKGKRSVRCFHCGIKRDFLEPDSSCPKSFNKTHHFGRKTSGPTG